MRYWRVNRVEKSVARQNIESSILMGLTDKVECSHEDLVSTIADRIFEESVRWSVIEYLDELVHK